ncbi:gamma-glutamylcyclotransferase family protein [Arsukibacterium sp.]|uniref:gamma-glutamylcyclotransferase family protein n=1 Tax=Arsukibacterium sp. TaxID=1977258 RepID=UPI002FD91248
MPELLFVYGTLRAAAGHSRHQLLQQYASFIAEGRFQAKLYVVDDYPGAVASDDARWQVSGEVYQLLQPERVLAELDQYEQCGPGFVSPTEYLRLKQQITLDTGDRVSAWVYVYNHPTDKLQQLMTGDFFRK